MARQELGLLNMTWNRTTASALVLWLTICIGPLYAHGFLRHDQSNQPLEVFALLPEDPAQPGSSTAEEETPDTIPSVMWPADQSIRAFIRKNKSFSSDSWQIYKLHSAFLI